ncbi:hypothetical protein LguiB_013545 [Lonicera macranthoides]
MNQSAIPSRHLIAKKCEELGFMIDRKYKYRGVGIMSRKEVGNEGFVSFFSNY